MKPEDPINNAKFVQIIEKYDCLYNYKKPEYNKKELVESVWAEIAKQMDDTADSCRKRWKTIREGFVRTHKNARFGNLKRPYYLSNYLQFLLPFTRGAADLEKTPPSQQEYNPSDEELQLAQSDASESEETTFSSILSNEIENSRFSDVLMTNGSKNGNGALKRKHNNDKLMMNGNNGGSRTANSWVTLQTKQLENSNQYFLNSLLPYLNEMTGKQSRRFRQKVIVLIDQVLDDSDMHHMSSHGSCLMDPFSPPSTTHM